MREIGKEKGGCSRGLIDDNRVSLYDTADGPEHSTNPKVGSKRACGHSSRIMSSTACHRKSQQPQPAHPIDKQKGLLGEGDDGEVRWRRPRGELMIT